MTADLLRQAEILQGYAQRSRQALDELSQPTAPRFSLPEGYSGSLYRFAPLSPQSIAGLSSWLHQQFWRQQSPATLDDLRALAAADAGLAQMTADIQAASGGLVSKLFGGGEKKRRAEAATAALSERVVSTSSAVSRLQPLFEQLAQLDTISPEAALAENKLGLRDVAARAVARFAGEQWENPVFEEVPVEAHAAYLAIWQAINTPERAQLMTGMGRDMQALKAERAQLTLADMPVDKLRDITSGTVRTAPLTQAGITTVAQVLSQGSPAALTRIPGVGETTAAQIYAAATRLLDEAAGQEKENLGQTRTPAAERILIGLDRLRVIDSTIGDSDLLDRLSSYAPLLTQPVPTTGPLFIAVGDDPTDYQQLLTDLEWCRTHAPLNVPAATWLTADQAWAGYLADPAAHQALLAHYLGNETIGDAYLPAEIFERIRKFPLDLTGLKATLRGYQNYGTKFMLAQKKIILGDEMGLGKTMQTLAALTHLANKGKTHFIVVCPASLVINWERETQKFTAISTYLAHGDSREEALSNWKAKGGLLITTYDGARLYSDGTWRADAVVADEAHLIKNKDAQRSQAVSALVRSAEYAVLLSGTPMENKVSEFVTLVDYLQPQLVAEAGMDSLLASEFRARIAPAYLRRNQKDVLSELPDMTEHRDWLELTPGDTDAYRQAVADGNFSLMRRAAWSADESAKLTRLLEIVEEATAADRKVLVFSFFLSVLSRLEAALGDKVVGLITGAMPPTDRQDTVDGLATAPSGSVLLAQITAAGAGLNIQSASIVVLAEPQFKPTIEAQAIARAHRMGQTHTVDVFRLLGADTVDERMIDLLGIKSQLFDEYARISAAKDSAAESVDISDSKMASQIIAEERARLGLESNRSLEDDQGTQDDPRTQADLGRQDNRPLEVPVDDQGSQRDK
ncbi:DEAD/DEAH box helicase [Rothia sp. P4278]|uniref:DEAD/DEAH box helicase n=1 Tax=Rothia sp. P4278 TaxID=3402658 RepID=UPI003AE84831